MIQRQYSKILQNKLRHIGRLMEGESVNRSMHLKGKHSGPIYKHSTSFTSESFLKSDAVEAAKVKGNSKRCSDDEMIKLGRLSLINMRARYELLNANRMLVDLDVSLSVSWC